MWGRIQLLLSLRHLVLGMLPTLGLYPIHKELFKFGLKKYENTSLQANLHFKFKGPNKNGSLPPLL